MDEIIKGFKELCANNSCPTCKYSGANDQWECAFRYAYEQGAQEGLKNSKEYDRIVGFMKWNQFCVVDNKGDYYSIEELEDMLKNESN